MAGLGDKLGKRQVSFALGGGQPPEDLAGQVLDIEVDRIEPDPGQPRKLFDEAALKALAESICTHGLLQPIVVRQAAPLFEGRLLIVAGERRWRAHKLAGIPRIKAMVIAEQRPAILQLVENLHREDLKPLEEAEALARLVEEDGYSQATLAGMLGRSKAGISETLSLTELPEEVKTGLRGGVEIPKRDLILIVREARRSTRRTEGGEDQTPGLFPGSESGAETEEERRMERMRTTLLNALEEHESPKGAWDEARQAGLTDEGLREAIRDSFKPEGAGLGYWVQGGNWNWAPAFWFLTGAEYNHKCPLRKPDLAGLELVVEARKLLDIPYPEEAPRRQDSQEPGSGPPEEPRFTKQDQAKEDKRWRAMVRNEIGGLHGYVRAYAESERHMGGQSDEELQDLLARLEITIPALKAMARKVAGEFKARKLKEREA